ncbi:MAG: hypothetical protein Q4D51_11905 [Eubacteriales bacterium]|nr:hypothetical protein [Eubacteriales bacterium]
MMKTKSLLMILAAMMVFSLSACEKELEEEQNLSFSTEQEKQGEQNTEAGTDSVSERENNEASESATDILGTISSSMFSGKVTGCYYADKQNVIVAAEKLYLYDMQKEEIRVSADISLDDMNVQSFSEGWFICGQMIRSSSGSFLTAKNSGGMTGYVLNEDFSIVKTIFFSELLDNDFALSPASIALSDNGEQLAIGGLHGLYLYDMKTGEMKQVLNYSENATANNMRILTMDSLLFLEQDKTLLYVGQGVSATEGDGQDGISIYGTFAVDGSNLSITKNATYAVDEVKKGGNIIVLTQSMNKNDGTCLFLDTETGNKTRLEFESDSEGEDGVFCSEKGKYIATAVLGDGSMTIYIYNTVSGEKIHTETIEDSNNLYFNRIPQILILDEYKTCIVLMGRGMDEVSTWMYSFTFEV